RSLNHFHHPPIPALYMPHLPHSSSPVFFFNHTATTEIYTLSLHDALPISAKCGASVPKGTPIRSPGPPCLRIAPPRRLASSPLLDRKSTRLNSSHVEISYAVFCLKKKNKNTDNTHISKA